jgi:CheY-like chemotaxis protein
MQVEEVIFDLRSNVAPRARAKGLELKAVFGNAVPRSTRGDPLRLRQVLLNLVSNAIKFTESGSIRIEVMPGGDPSNSSAVLFRVVDTGIGIDSKSANRLFDPFTQADSATTCKYGGTGLGLTISRRLVMLMGGTIGVDSTPGTGSTFWFLIPLEAEEPPVADPRPAALLPAQSAGENASPSQGRVLIVDDNAINQLVARKAVQRVGYEAAVAGDGAAAPEMIAGSRFHVVLMDWTITSANRSAWRSWPKCSSALGHSARDVRRCCRQSRASIPHTTRSTHRSLTHSASLSTPSRSKPSRFGIEQLRWLPVPHWMVTRCSPTSSKR